MGRHDRASDACLSTVQICTLCNGRLSDLLEEKVYECPIPLEQLHDKRGIFGPIYAQIASEYAAPFIQLSYQALKKE